MHRHLSVLIEMLREKRVVTTNQKKRYCDSMKNPRTASFASCIFLTVAALLFRIRRKLIEMPIHMHPHLSVLIGMLCEKKVVTTNQKKRYYNSMKNPRTASFASCNFLTVAALLLESNEN